MSEAHETPYIPGDEVSVDIGGFEHHQNLLGVRVIYVNRRSATGIELEGNVEETRDIARGDAGPTLRSSATASATIEEGRAPGQYEFDRIEGYTYSGVWVRFTWEEEQLRQRSIPSVLHVYTEPPGQPRLV